MARIEVTIDDNALRKALQKLSQTASDTQPVMAAIGEHLLNSTRERFNAQTDPGGTPWAPLSTHRKKRKKRNKDKVLTWRGFLRANIAYRTEPDEVTIGSPSIYAATHQFGAPRGAFGATAKGSPIPWGDIPARPFLGIADDDRDAISRIVLNALDNATATP